jgi:hypothetical protein
MNIARTKSLKMTQAKNKIEVFKRKYLENFVGIYLHQKKLV